MSEAGVDFARDITAAIDKLISAEKLESCDAKAKQLVEETNKFSNRVLEILTK